MPAFHFKALTASGETVEGMLEAQDQAGVVHRLRQLGHRPIRVDPVRGFRPLRLARSAANSRQRVSPRDLVFLTRQLATMLEAAVPLDQALVLTRDAGAGSGARALVARLRNRLRAGDSLGDALAAEDPAAVPSYYVAIVRAGEAAGSLPAALGQLADFLEQSRLAREQVRSSLVYPTIVFLVSLAAIGMFLFLVLPRFAELFAGTSTPLPAVTRMILGLSRTLAAKAWLILLILLALLLLLRAWLTRPAVQRTLDGLRLRLPVVGMLEREIEIARLARTLAVLITNGVPVTQALAMCSGVLGNAHLRDALQEVTDAVPKGLMLSEALARTAQFPPLATQFVAVGEHSGELGSMLERLADIYERQSSETMKRLLALLVPALTIASAVVVAAVFGSILSALLSVYDLAR
jgi:general secretion pathway protein F